ncbi:hypothetical protein QQF64_002245 [Cirrhinus molitorella]|uniref:Uncharacterized protein n=1 Tax=Cirrhinus molitorella TaxID=172907 RepID=A0ABR3MPL4_9TELE
MLKEQFKDCQTQQNCPCFGAISDRAARFPNADDSLGRPSSTRQALHVLLLSCRREGRLCVLVDLELKEAVPGAAAAAAVGWTGHGWEGVRLHLNRVLGP